jgi:hypothetical protein
MDIRRSDGVNSYWIWSVWFVGDTNQVIKMEEVIKLYILSDSGNIKRENQRRIKIEEHIFNYNNPADRETIEEYLPLDEEELTLDNFKETCKTYLIYNDVMEMEQRWCRCVILDEKDIEDIKWVIDNGIEKIS